jgi:putative oxidoreductase
MESKSTLQRILATRPSWATLPIRLVLGLVMAAHGAQKLFGWFGGYGLEGTGGFFESNLGLSPGIFWAALAGAGEFFGGLLVLAGLATRLAAFNLAVVMLVAITQVHLDAFFAPAGFEYPLTLLGASLALVISGGGSLSVDALLQKRYSDAAQPRTRPEIGAVEVA